MNTTGCIRARDMNIETLKAMGFADAREIRGKICIGFMPVDLMVNGIPTNFTRRRYGSKTFCWVEAMIDDEWKSLGDPWECITPKAIEISDAILRILHP
jgi:hypothetical protein